MNQFEILQAAKNKLKESKTYQDLCKKYKIDQDYIDLVPVCFKQLNVSARTEHGVIYLNSELLNNLLDNLHYLLHEFNHHLQQCFGETATKGSDYTNYLDNPYEKDSFKEQSEYISETKGDDKAKQYIEKVLDHHDVPEKEKKDRTKDLLRLANDKKHHIRSSKELMDEYDAEIEKGNLKSVPNPWKLNFDQREDRLSRLKEIADRLQKDTK